ncbi:MAG: hydroxymethylbilane synthase [Chloroflexi bacterium]|nr:MAG: hydroxymethylbilane synthase [Chloroflexota bacterium]
MTAPSSALMPAGSVRVLRVGTRGSALALVQTQRVIDALKTTAPHVQCEVVVISTQGDRDKQTPLSQIGGQGVFASEIQQALLRGEIDCAVHSAKDLPSQLPDGSLLAAVLDREDRRDALVSRYAGGIAGLPPGARVGASSPRRRAQLLVTRPDVEMVELRGNVDTRMRKVLDDPEQAYDAALLAVAGVERMGWGDRISERLDVATFTPAPGQGALAVECRSDDSAVQALLEAVADPNATAEVAAERAFLRAIGGGCRSPLAATAQVVGDRIHIWAMFADEGMSRVAFTQDEADLDDGPDLAQRLARELQKQVAQ